MKRASQCSLLGEDCEGVEVWTRAGGAAVCDFLYLDRRVRSVLGEVGSHQRVVAAADASGGGQKPDKT